MKKQLTVGILILGWVTFAPVSAQPVLTYSNNAPQPGETYDCWMASVLPVLQTVMVGSSNYTWDFSGAAGVPYMNMSHFNPGTTPNGSLYPTATVACQQPMWGPNMIYMQVDSGQLLELGFNAQVWTNPRTVLTYPLTFNDTYADTGTYLAPPINWAWHVSGVADGYGTVILPYGAVNDVLRVKETTNRYSGMGWVLEHSYSWYQEETHTPICQFWTDGVDAYFFYRLPAVIIGVDEMNAAAKPVVYPNPFSQNVSIQIPGIKDEQYTFTVYDITGKLIHHENVYINGDQKITRDFGFIQNGVYIIQLKSENQVFQTRIVKH